MKTVELVINFSLSRIALLILDFYINIAAKSRNLLFMLNSVNAQKHHKIFWLHIM